ncbi:MAG: acylphosphatase [Opitutaceae bacterium]|nr:acylphosphatase [Opitutaceae bacterium]
MSHVQHGTIFYSGHVQGVGFRYAVLQIAKEFEVAGYVRNLPDGRVQVEVEGTAADITAFVDAVEERMHGFVRNIERQSALRPRQFSGFTIQ